VFEMVDAQYVSDGTRKVFRCELHPVKKTVLSDEVLCARVLQSA